MVDTDTGGCSVPRGRGLLEDPTRPAKQQQLGQELKELMSKEQALDQLIQSCSQSFKHLTEDKANKRYPVCGGKGSGSLLTAIQVLQLLPAGILSWGLDVSVSSFLGLSSQAY